MSFKSRTEDGSEERLREIANSLDEIRRLLIYALLRNGASQGDVAAALGTTQGTISKLLANAKKPARRRK